jgi:hypothetical protein
MARRRIITTRPVSWLWDIYRRNQIELAPEFQRNSVWPSAAKAYFIDTILNDKPIPLFFLSRGTSAQTGQSIYAVVDGQQRLRSLLGFIGDEYRLTQSSTQRFSNRKFSELGSEDRARILDYELVIEELIGYSDEDIRDIFSRINEYVVKLSLQELRNARGAGAFHRFVTAIGAWPFWRKNRVFSANQSARMRPVEFAAELVILLIEGPQDKKAVVDLYYGEYKNKRLPAAKATKRKLWKHLRWIASALPTLHATRYRKPVDLYALVGAIESLSKLPPHRNAREKLLAFEEELERGGRSALAETYLFAASRQTDNIGPRNARIEVLSSILRTSA